MTPFIAQERNLTGSTSVTSFALAFVNPVIAQSGIHAISSQETNISYTYTMSDSLVNTYSTPTSAWTTQNGGNGMAHSTVVNAIGGADTVTAGFSGATASPTLWIREISNVGIGAIDGTSITNLSNTSATTASDSATNANQPAFISALGWAPAGGITNVSATSGTQDVANGWFGDATSSHQLISSTGSQSASFSANLASGWVVCMAIFDANNDTFLGQTCI